MVPRPGACGSRTSTRCYRAGSTTIALNAIFSTTYENHADPRSERWARWLVGPVHSASHARHQTTRVGTVKGLRKAVQVGCSMVRCEACVQDEDASQVELRPPGRRKS